MGLGELRRAPRHMRQPNSSHSGIDKPQSHATHIPSARLTPSRSNLKHIDARTPHRPAYCHKENSRCLLHAVIPAREPCSLPRNGQPSEVCLGRSGPWIGKDAVRPGLLPPWPVGADRPIPFAMPPGDQRPLPLEVSHTAAAGLAR